MLLKITFLLFKLILCHQKSVFEYIKKYLHLYDLKIEFSYYLP